MKKKSRDKGLQEYCSNFGYARVKHRRGCKGGPEFQSWFYREVRVRNGEGENTQTQLVLHCSCRKGGYHKTDDYTSRYAEALPRTSKNLTRDLASIDS